jgi:ubiquinone/menaquinone biosynthesis C-methylase UbiE
MTQDREQAEGTLAQQMFGPQAGVYATSKVHISDDSLESVQKLTTPSSSNGIAPYRWAVDIGTGAGFTAFAMAEVSERVVASDITQPMLRQAKRISGERNLGNVMLTQNAAESLPFADGSVDLITCRAAAHHFMDFEKSLAEARRALKTGGSLVVSDNVAPEDDALHAWINDMELRRDFSHIEDRKVSVVQGALDELRLRVVDSEMTWTNLQFDDWVARTNTPSAEVDALRRDFLTATPEMVDAFRIAPQEDGDIHFSWPCWIFRAVKSLG